MFDNRAIAINVAATHDTLYQNDAGGIKASSRWLSEATPQVMDGGKSFWHPGRGARPYAALSTGGVVAETLLNHRLLAAMPPASSRSKSVINGREEYRNLHLNQEIL